MAPPDGRQDARNRSDTFVPAVPLRPAVASDRVLRRVYLLVLGIVILALAISAAARQQSGVPEFFIQVVTPPLIVVFGAVMVWLLLGRALHVAETVMVWGAGLASLANVTAFSVAPHPPSYYLNAGPYLSVLVAFTFLLLVHTRPRTGQLALGLLVVSLALPWILQNGSVTDPPLDLLRLQTQITATAVMIYLLSWYRSQHFSSVQRQQMLSALAYSDPLTGLPNRRGLMLEVAGEPWRRNRLNALLLVDVDHFKVVNDRHGHAVGDEVLGTAADVLSGITGSRGTVGRWGGDEFLIVLPGMDAPAALAHAEELVHAFRGQRWPHGLNVTVSVGGAGGVTSGSLDADLARADAALYHVKTLGRNRAAVYDLLDEQTRQRLMAGGRAAPDLHPA